MSDGCKRKENRWSAISHVKHWKADENPTRAIIRFSCIKCVCVFVDGNIAMLNVNGLARYQNIPID